ncbi:hypothetical protein ACT80S_05330 [Ramlibacter sp. MAHUQ-53]|uniref:hypothetical protein n=1 Tax=unclassified Ramlibacter TaxID=2617605 RepID=UPI003642DF28
MQPKPTAGSPASWSPAPLMHALAQHPLPPPTPALPEGPDLAVGLSPPNLRGLAGRGRLDGRDVAAGTPGQARSGALQGGAGPGEVPPAVAGGGPGPAPAETFDHRMASALSGLVRTSSACTPEAQAAHAAQAAALIGVAGLAPAGREALARRVAEACLEGVPGVTLMGTPGPTPGPTPGTTPFTTVEVPVATATALMRAIVQALPAGAAREAWCEALHRHARDLIATRSPPLAWVDRFARALGDLHGGRQMPVPTLRALVSPLVREASRLPATSLLAFAEGLSYSLGEPRIAPGALRELLRLPLALVPLRDPADMAGAMWLFTRGAGGSWLSSAQAEVLMGGLLEADDLPPESLGYMAWALARARLAGVAPMSPEAPIHADDPPPAADLLLVMARQASPAETGRLLMAVGVALRSEDQVAGWVQTLLPRMVAMHGAWTPLQVAAAACGLAVGISDGALPRPMEGSLQAVLKLTRGGPWGAPRGLAPAQLGVALAARPLQVLAEPALSPGDQMALLEAVFSIPRVLDGRSVPALFSQVLALDLPTERKAEVLAMLMRLGSAHVTPQMLEAARALGPDAKGGAAGPGGVARGAPGPGGT